MLGRRGCCVVCRGTKLSLAAELQFEHRIVHTLMPSSEKQGGTAELSSSASDRRIGNLSTADIGMSPL